MHTDFSTIGTTAERLAVLHITKLRITGRFRNGGTHEGESANTAVVRHQWRAWHVSKCRTGAGRRTLHERSGRNHRDCAKTQPRIAGRPRRRLRIHERDTRPDRHHDNRRPHRFHAGPVVRDHARSHELAWRRTTDQQLRFRSRHRDVLRRLLHGEQRRSRQAPDAHGAHRSVARAARHAVRP